MWQAQSSSSFASVLCRGSRKGQSRWLFIRSVSLERRLSLGDKCLISALEIVRCHANRLRLCFCLNGLVQSHVPFLVEHFLSHAMSKRGTGGKFTSQHHSGGEEFFGGATT